MPNRSRPSRIPSRAFTLMELVIVLVIVMLVFGTHRLRDAGRDLGRP